MSFPPGLHLIDRRPETAASPRDAATASEPPGRRPGTVAVVLVHGSLDRGDSFRRVIRRLGDRRVVAYDRRGYAGSRQAGPSTDLGGHVADLLEVATALGPDPVVAVGHSYGGDVVIAAALAEPARFAAIGAYEPPMPWLGFRRPAAPATAAGDGEAAARWPPLGEPGEEAERFFRRMVGDAVWERLPPAARADRRADGPALVGDMRVIRGPAPFDVRALGVPVVFGRGSPASAPHHRQGTAWLAGHVRGATLFEIEGASHGAHLSHPDHFAALVRATAARATVDPGGVGDDGRPAPASAVTTGAGAAGEAAIA